MESKFFIAGDVLIRRESVETVMLDGDTIHIGYTGASGTSPIKYATQDEAYAKFLSLAKWLEADKTIDIGGTLNV